MGPILLFDKSFVEMLSVDQAAIFDALFSTNICPIYYVEVLADLEKQVLSGRTPEKAVGDMARKTPVCHSYPNMSHVTTCLAELLGQKIEMGRVPVVGGGRPLRQKGKVGIIYEESPESRAFDRWQCGAFLEVEREFASEWRAQLKALDHAAMAKLAKVVLKIEGSPKTLKEALHTARQVVRGEGQHFYTLRTAYALLGLPAAFWPDVQKLWKANGYLPLPVYAPYTAYCLTVDVFFHLCIDKGLISPDRASNKTDIAYVYYLPFAMGFVSNDKLHKRVTALFAGPEQLFIDGQDLKDDMVALDAYLWSLPEEQREQGLFKLASRPPDDDRFLTTRLWRHFRVPVVPPRPRAGEDDQLNEALLRQVRELKAHAARGIPAGLKPADISDPDQLVMQRSIPVQRGKWRILPPGTEGTAQ